MNSLNTPGPSSSSSSFQATNRTNAAAAGSSRPRTRRTEEGMRISPLSERNKATQLKQLNAVLEAYGRRNPRCNPTGQLLDGKGKAVGQEVRRKNG